jgi:predicted nucleic acid-binding protein
LLGRKLASLQADSPLLIDGSDRLVSLQCLTVLAQGQVVALDADLAVAAARIASAHKLAMADAVILATARHCTATLWTQDPHFRGMDGVEYRAPR